VYASTSAKHDRYRETLPMTTIPLAAARFVVARTGTARLS
jgi:hypothetical protein